MQINIIAAVAQNRAIGYKNRLLYWLPNDLKRFKSLTTGHTIVMGHNTYRSLPKGALPNRRNVVLTRQKDLALTGCDCYTSVDEVLRNCEQDEEIYVIGGESVYRLFMEKADLLRLTIIDDVPEKADAFFPEFSDFRETSRQEHPKDERHAYNYAFVDYKRR